MAGFHLFFMYSYLLAAQRTATLRRDDDCQATLLNLLLRNYLLCDLYDQADKLVSKSSFPESANNAQYARYMYYLGMSLFLFSFFLFFLVSIFVFFC